jgi:hypothetical protein
MLACPDSRGGFLLPNGLKKWFMLQVWRLQQVAQILTLALLAFNLSLLLYDKMSWRSGLFESPYTGIPVILLVLAAGMWAFAIFWDLRMKMWREQATVLIDRNPFAKEKMTSKEIAMYELLWFPLLERLGKDDPKMRESVAALRRWVVMAAREESVAGDTRDLMKHLGMDAPDYVRKDKGK